MLSFFKDLGDRIERSWLTHNYDEEIFPSLAIEALEAKPPSANVKVDEIIEFAFQQAPFRQPANQELFGEPPIMLYFSPRFYIEALFWFSGTTAIHEHSFSGAFSVLAGSSVHSHWRFARQGTVNSRMLFGQLERVSTEILSPGGTRPIHSGDRLIHQLFHLEVPSVTIVVRTYVDRHHLPQYAYLLPGLALDDKDRDSSYVRRSMLLDAMMRGSIPGLEHYCQRLVDESDLESIFYYFSMLYRRKIDRALLEKLTTRAQERFGSIIRLFQEVYAWDRRTRIIVALRSKVSDSGPRFLLAILMLMPNRDAIFEAVRLRDPETDPLTSIESWLEGLSKDMIGFAFDNANRLIFRGLVQGLNEDAILEQLSQTFKGDSVTENRELLMTHIRKMASSDLFFPLFSESQLRPELQHK